MKAVFDSTEMLIVMEFAVPTVPRSTLGIEGSDQCFPVNNIYCVGRNYADHAVEMGHDPDREPPFFFIKPTYCLLSEGGEMAYPAQSQDVHHEVEMVIALGAGGENIPLEESLKTVFGYGVGIDMTRRDLQAEAKAAGRPWDAGKVFAHSAPCSRLVATPGSVLEAGEISLEVNGEVRQQGDVNQMIWKVAEVISRLSELFPLAPGDLIFTGTPAGVGPIQPGDQLVASIGNTSLEVNITS